MLVTCIGFFIEAIITKYSGESEAQCKSERRDRELLRTNPQGLLKMVSKVTALYTLHDFTCLRATSH